MNVVFYILQMTKVRFLTDPFVLKGLIRNDMNSAGNNWTFTMPLELVYECKDFFFVYEDNDDDDGY